MKYIINSLKKIENHLDNCILSNVNDLDVIFIHIEDSLYYENLNNDLVDTENNLIDTEGYLDIQFINYVNDNLDNFENYITNDLGNINLNFNYKDYFLNNLIIYIENSLDIFLDNLKTNSKNFENNSNAILDMYLKQKNFNEN
jgi:hypothetical protein